MHRLALFVLIARVAANAAFILGTTHRLPDSVATHFAARGRANGWMPRNLYLAFTLGLATVLPIAIAAVIALTPGVAPRAFNMPHREYWLSEERRSATRETLAGYGRWLGCLLCIFFAAVHYSIVEANATVPPQLPTRLFVAIIVCFFAALVFWMGAFYMRFRRRA